MDGSIGWTSSRAVPILDGDGEIVEWFGAASDVTARREAEARQRLLLAELQHRVRNVLAVVRSISRRTAANSETVEQYAAHLDGRLNALARTQAAVTRDPAGGLDLEQIVRDELLAYQARDGQLRVEGPEVRLDPKTGESMALAIHELATNSVKYGALSAPDGKLRVTWRIDGNGAGPALDFEWREGAETIQGGVPARRGFGSELLERSLAYDLGAKTALDYQAGNFRCTIEFPLKARAAPSARPVSPELRDG
jgi:two-component system CheB/CheR fusion protein